jgi:biotin carboxyl carrier protein
MRIELACAVLLTLCVGTACAHSDASAFAGDTGRDHDGVEASATTNVVQVDSDLIEVARVEQRRVVETRAGIGRVIAPAGIVHDVNAFISGQLKRLYVRAGSRVRAGDPVALIDSPEFVLTQKAFVALLGNTEKLEILGGEGRLPNYMKDARENLRWWGLGDADIAELEATGTPLEGITVRAPVDGVISEVLAQPGDLLSAGDRTMAQFVVMGRAIARVIADERPLWAEGLLYPDDLAGVALEQTRQLARLLVKLERRDDLYPGQPLHLELLLKRPEQTWAPRAALMGQGPGAVVFVQTRPGTYVRTAVDAGVAVGDWVPVAGLASGTVVVTAGKLALEGAYRLMRSGAPVDDHHH